MYSIQDVKQKLANDYAWQKRALIVLYRAQTKDEQRASQTKHNNGVGFNAPDAKRLSYYARLVNSGRELFVGPQKYCAKMLPKYAEQLLTVHGRRQ